MRKFYVLGLMFLFGWMGVKGQVLISPTGDGGFETGTTFAANGWTSANGSATNRVWYVGTGQSGYTGSRAAFIGNTTTNVGSNGAARIVHFFRSVTIPSGATNIQLSFKYKQATRDNTFDFSTVFLNNNIPVAGTAQTNGILATLDPVLNSTYSAFTTVSVSIPNTFAGTTNNLIFSFQSDNAAPDAYGAFDEISLTYTPAALCSTPTPGNTLSSASNLCFGAPITLSLQNTTTGSGVTYQWVSSPDGITYTNVTGANSATLTITPTVNTYFKCIVTCSVGPSSATSNPVYLSFANSILSTIPNTRCGVGSVTLGATGNSGTTLKWYPTSSGGASLGTGPSFTTPSIAATTPYYVGAESNSPYSAVTGTGTQNISGDGITPFGHAWEGERVQYLLLASNLSAAGFSAGTLSSLSFNVVTKNSTGSFLNFTIKMAATSATSMSGILTPAFSTVYGPVSYSTVAGVNLFTFSNSFSWDGTTNILVDVCFGQNSGYSANDVVKGTSQSYNCNFGLYDDASLCGATTAFFNASNQNLPNMTFTGSAVCSSPRTMVSATVTTPPVLILDKSTDAVCSGSSSTVTVTSAASNYDTYSWTGGPLTQSGTPSGTIVNLAPILNPTVYTLTATNTVSGCVDVKSVNVTVNPMPSANSVTPSSATVCSGSIQTLTATGGLAPGTFTSNVIGTGTGAPGAQTYPNPLSAYYGGAKHQMIFTAAELTAIGLTANSTISRIGLWINNVNTTDNLNDFTIRIGSTSATALTGFINGTITVYNSNFIPTVTGLVNFNLTTFFVWNGTSNLVIETIHNAGITGVNNGTRTRFTTTTTNMTYYGASDDVTPAGVASFDALSTYDISGATTSRPNIYFGYTNLVAQPVTWSPLTELYTDNLATVAYTGTATSVVYAKPTATRTYIAKATISTGTGCSSSSTSTLTVTPMPDATLSYTGSPFCGAGTISPTMGGTYNLTGGTYSSTTGLSINPSTGVVNLAVSLPGTYTITYTVAPAGGCAAYTSTTPITVRGNEWLGINNDWFDALNWCAGVPTATTNVVIPAGLPKYPAITTGNALANNVSIANGASIVVTVDGIFSFYGSVTNAGIFELVDGTLNLAGIGSTIGGSTITGGVIKNLMLSNGGASSIAAGPTNMLKVSGNISFVSSNNTFNTNDNLTLTSTSTTTASLTDMTANGTLSGNLVVGTASVERWFPATRKWRFLAARNTTGSVTIQNSWMEGQVPGQNNGLPFYGMWVTDASDLAGGFDGFSYTPNVKWWNGSDYTGISSPSYDLRNQEAYMTYVRGDRSATGTNSVTSATVLRTEGGLRQGTTPATTIDPLSTFTAIGNPYASAIDLSKLLFTSAISDPVNVLVWDPNLAGGLGLGAFQTLTRLGNGTNFTINPGGGSYIGKMQGDIVNTIESGQAFFVQSSGLPNSVSFPEVAKTPREQQVFFTPGAEQSASATLSMQDGAGYSLMDGFRVFFRNSYNSAANLNDGRKLNNLNENASVKTDNTLLAIEFRNTLNENDTIHINIAGMRIRNYRWKFTLANLDEAGRVAFLIDRFTGTETSLNLAGTNAYDFAVSSAAASYAADRFIIVFRPAQVVPVKFTSITANRQADGSNLVKWNTATEINIHQYEAERSANGTTFTSLGVQTAPTNNNGGTASYTQTDSRPLSAVNYYRIKAISLNGQVQYSAIVKVSPLNQEPMIAVNPNPVRGGTFNLIANNMEAGNYRLQISAADGKVVYNSSISLQAGSNRKSISLNSATAQGEYSVVLMSEKGEKQAARITVLN